LFPLERENSQISIKKKKSKKHCWKGENCDDCHGFRVSKFSKKKYHDFIMC